MSEPSPFFMRNHAFSGKKGGEIAYMLQNVMEAQRIPSKRRAVVMTEKQHNSLLILFTPEEFQELAEWNAAPVSKGAKAKLALAKKKAAQHVPLRRVPPKMPDRPEMGIREPQRKVNTEGRLSEPCVKYPPEALHRFRLDESYVWHHFHERMNSLLEIAYSCVRRQGYSYKFL